MAQSAIVYLPISRETRRIENLPAAGLRRMGGLVLHMVASVAVALFTGNAQCVAAGVSEHATISLNLKRGAMTFETSRDDDPSKIYLTVHIARTVYPLVYSGQIGDRQFEQHTVLPIEIGL